MGVRGGGNQNGNIFFGRRAMLMKNGVVDEKIYELMFKTEVCGYICMYYPYRVLVNRDKMINDLQFRE